MPSTLHEPASGLRNVANNENLYRKLLGKFAAQQANAATEIEQALQAGDMELAQRLVHTLKGLSASMGLPGLTETSLAMETAFKTGDDTTALLTQLREDLQASLRAVAEYLGSAG